MADSTPMRLTLWWSVSWLAQAAQLAVPLLLSTWRSRCGSLRLPRRLSVGEASSQCVDERPGESPRDPEQLTTVRTMPACGRLHADASATGVCSQDWRALTRLADGGRGELP